MTNEKHHDQEKANQNPAAASTGAMPAEVAVDDGYAYTKVAWLDPETGRLKTHSIPSRAVAGLHVSTNFEGKSEGGYLTGGMEYTVGDHSDAVDTRENNYPFSALNRAIVHHALRDSGFARDADHTIERLGLTIPFRDYYTDPEAIKDKRARSFSETVEAVTPGAHKLHIESAGVRVFPEAAVAWVDHVLHDDGTDAGDVNEPVAIIDVGGRTTDVAIMPDGGGTIDQQASGTDTIGVMDVISDLQQRIRVNNDNVTYPFKHAETTLRTGKIMLFGQSRDASEEVEAAKRQVTEQIYQAVSRRVADKAPMLSRMIFVGGGASVLKETLRQYPHVEVPEHPEFANARGVLKYMLYSS